VSAPNRMGGDGINKASQHDAIDNVRSHLGSLGNGTSHNGDACFCDDKKLATTRQFGEIFRRTGRTETKLHEPKGVVEILAVHAKVLFFAGKTEAFVVGISPKGDAKANQVKDEAGKGCVQYILMMDSKAGENYMNESWV
jgi:hypothetical protein